MPGDFAERIDELSKVVGSGQLEGKMEVDQVYAHYQHEGMDLKHPHGGQAKFLETALHAGADTYLQSIADRVLDGGAVDGMVEAVDQLDTRSAQLTPKEATVLARSGHLTVTDQGAVVYDKPPEVPRLSEAELEEIHDRDISIHHPYGRR